MWNSFSCVSNHPPPNSSKWISGLKDDAKSYRGDKVFPMSFAFGKNGIPDAKNSGCIPEYTAEETPKSGEGDAAVEEGMIGIGTRTPT
jgi:hypothetical protein